MSNNIGFNNKAWGSAVGNLGSGMVPFQSSQQQQVFQSSIGLQQQNLVGLQQMANNMSNSLNCQLASNHLFQQVSYPNARVNTQAFQTNITAAVHDNPGTGAKQKVFTGKVTQLHENFGLVDDEVIFQLNACVKGHVPMMGDRVLVEASYMPNMHFKWSATRIQVLSANNQPRSSKSYGNSNNYNNPTSDRSGRKALNRRERSRERDRCDDENERKRRRGDKGKEKEKSKSPLRRRSRSPKLRRRSRMVPRYMVQIPRIALDISEGDVLEIRRRYPNLYIPSDFFLTHIRWVDSFPPHKPFALNKPCSFHILNKEIIYKESEALLENDAVVEPPDADYLFSAKVMLMSVPVIEDLYQKCCGIAEEKDKSECGSDDREGDYVHPTRLINFLIGLRGKNETMAIGGPWSPSLDGENPDEDESVLIKTAIRTCRALTGIDLSSCTQWYRFVEMYYRRAESTHKGKLIPARVETVVLLLPDVWSCLPTRLEWDNLQITYKKKLDRILNTESPEMVDDDECAASSTVGIADEKEEETNDMLNPTHHSKLDPKNMNVNELRIELDARNISSKGLKSQLVARLQKTLKSEAERMDDNVEKDKKDDEVVEVDLSGGNNLEGKKSEESEEKEKVFNEKEKSLLEKRYTLPNHQHILVHPSKIAKSGKFDCTIMSLSLLLDYRQEDSKEHSFEVSLFAELFNEMLIRDFGFNIYRALYELPEKTKEDKKDKDGKIEKEEKKDKKREKKKNDNINEKNSEDDNANSKADDDNHKLREEEKKDKNETKESEKERKESYREEKQHEESNEDDDDDKDRRKDKKGNKKDKKEKLKLYTQDKHLLLSFVYFDQSHCGYIFDKDIEDLLYTLGLKLSRAQIKKLVGKVVVRDSLHYRKLTDKSKEEDVPTENSEKVFYWQELANGNKKYFPIFERNKVKKNNAMHMSTGLQEGFVLFQGSVVDINKLMSHLERSEKTRIETEFRMVTLKTDNQKLQEKYDKSNSTIKRLNSEVKDYKEKLRNIEDSLSRISVYSKLYETTLTDIRDKTDTVLKSTLYKEEVKKEKDRDDKDRKYDDAKSRWEKDEKIKKEIEDIEMLDSK